MQTRHIIHLDMDAFYASVELLDNPSLQGKPIIVGGSKKRGVVSAASYEARKYGVHSALPIMRAKQLCPDGIFLPPRMARYREISRQIMALFQQYTPKVEPISLDEAFLDITHSIRLFGSPEEIAAEIRKRVKDTIGLTVSAGISTSKLLAKIASDQNKPNGLTIVPPGKEKEFIAPLPIKRLWGAGKTTIQKLELMGIKTIGDLGKIPVVLLQKKLGDKSGLHLHLASNAIDNREVTPEREVKSIGHEDTFETDIIDREELKKKLLELAFRVSERVRQHQLVGRTLTIKVKYYDFSQATRSVTMQEATNDSKTLYNSGLALLDKTMAGQRELRLLGIYLSNFQPTDAFKQGLLFTPQKEAEKRKKLNLAIDRINKKFTKEANIRKIKPARLIKM